MPIAVISIRSKSLPVNIPDNTAYADRMAEIRRCYLDKINEGTGDTKGMANLISQKIVGRIGLLKATWSHPLQAII